MARNMAIEVLEAQIERLTSGIGSIDEQVKSLADNRERTKIHEKNLARDKKALVEIQAALAILKAGEE